ncbi:piggyBac transposable element-derived protein 4-like isoform X2 [Rhinichthys klamathensis goyatoka]|uniref:piggyBac transposable element-derived protein 4-like isoform X2 n=1 Tax=Rhinichthys klamathensis goyatoka TaxID=3034132 RepID=UPI0024B61561|nr:piggyBac transposable element-derived protein 4-like isoform X2 [Rhinichthys klamathensis goyatoka]
MASRKVFVGVEAVLAELDRDSDTETCSNASFDSVRQAAYEAGEDPDFDLDSGDEWQPDLPCTSSKEVVPPHTSKTPTLSVGDSVRQPRRGGTPSMQTRGRAPSVRGMKRSASVMSEDGGTERWNDCSLEDEVPALPNFLPKRNPGAQLVMDRIYSPLQLFQLFFSSSVVETIVNNTNSFAQKRSEAGKRFLWLPLVAHELYSYMALVIYMGLLGAKNIVDYWSGQEIYSLPFPKSVMSRSRFQAISWNLHLCDPEDDRENSRKKGTEAYDRLFKIKPLYNDIVLACKTYFHPDRQLAVDERMWGYKLYVLADSACGYTWNFFVYEGKSSSATGKGLSYDSVMQLLDLSLLGKGYQLFMDNFYTSPCLFLDLLSKKTLACGTIRTNRRGFPKTKVNDISRRAQRGTFRWLRDGKLLFVKWMDTREVTMCSTMHKAYEGDEVLRRVKNPEGVWERHRVPIPAAVKDYNKHMGGVDLSDALIGYYNVLHKTTKWYKTFFFHFVDIAVVNGFILHQHLCKSQNKSPLTQKEFRERLVSELAGQSSTPDAPEAPASSSRAPEAPASSSRAPEAPASSSRAPEAPASSSRAPEAPVSSSCAPEPSTSATTAVEQCFPEYFGSDAASGRRACALCKLSGLKVKTPMYCVKCNVALCLVPSRNCFRKWHTDGHSKL